MPLLLTMSLFGSIGTLGYLVLLPWAKKYLSVQWRRCYLICNILEYIVPFPCLCIIYKDLLGAVVGTGRRLCGHVENMGWENCTENIIQIAPRKIYIPDAAVYILSAAVMIAGIVIFCCWFCKYRRIRRFVRGNAEPAMDDHMYTETINRYAFAYNNGAIRVCECGAVDTPFVMGIVRPVMVLPNREWTETELKMVTEHEMVHIRQKDNLVKVLALIMLSLNFYNPLAWYVLYQWNDVAELSCDRKVIAGKTKEEIRQYGLLVVRIAEEGTCNAKFPIMGFSMQNKIMKERINQMKNGAGKESALKKIVAVGVMGIVLFASSLSVFAHSPKTIMYSDEITDEIYFSAEGKHWGDLYADPPVNGGDGWVFFNGEGDMIEVLDGLNPDADLYVVCVHNYVSGEATKHTKYSDNSCKVEYFEAQKCSKCGDTKLGKLLDVITHLSCCH